MYKYASMYTWQVWQVCINMHPIVKLDVYPIVKLYVYLSVSGQELNRTQFSVPST